MGRTQYVAIRLLRMIGESTLNWLSYISKLAEASKEAVRIDDVFADLSSQFVGAVKFLLRAQALPEMNLDALRSNLLRKIQQMGFDGDTRSIERRPDADVGHRAARFAFGVDARPRHINPLRGEHLLFRLQIQRREGELSPDASAFDDFSGQHKRAPKQPRCVRNVALSDRLTDARARNDFAAMCDWRNHNDVETQAHSQFAQSLYIARLAMAEVEIFTDENSPNLQVAHQNLINEFLWRQPRQIQRKRHYHGRLEADHPEPIHALRARREARRRGFGLKHFSRRGIECEHCRNTAGFDRALLDGAQNRLMTQVNTVEIADRQDAPALGRGIVRRPFRGRSEPPNFRMPRIHSRNRNR